MANALSLLINRAVDMGSLKGMKLNRWCPVLTHLFFTDDAIFFLAGKTLECQNLANVINEYCLATGQIVNRNKSGMFFSKMCPISLQENLARELRVPLLARTSKYLGIPSDWGQSKKEMFAWILSQVQSKLEGWKERLISKGGKEVLIKSVVQAIPSYAMSIFQNPIVNL